MTTWLTQDAYDRLKSEYEKLAGEGRTSISKKIEAAREEGDLKENGGYHAAKEEQGKMEARIKQLRHLLETAQVGEAPAADGTVKAGMVVSVEFVGGALDGEKEQFLLGSREQAGDVDIEVYSAQSPLGRRRARRDRRLGGGLLAAQRQADAGTHPRRPAVRRLTAGRPFVAHR